MKRHEINNLLNQIPAHAWYKVYWFELNQVGGKLQMRWDKDVLDMSEIFIVQEPDPDFMDRKLGNWHITMEINKGEYCPECGLQDENVCCPHPFHG